jgi:hypothetical protein
MPAKKTPASKRATRASVKSKPKESGGVQKRSNRPTRPTRIIDTPASPEPEPDIMMSDNEDSTETRFQEMDARLQANEHALSDLSSNMSEVLQILRQPAQSPHHRAAVSLSQTASEPRPFLYQPPTTVTSASSILPTYGYSSIGNNPDSSHSYSPWDWVDAETADSIVKGKFDLNNLPKLFRDYTDRQAHIILTTDGVHLPADGTRPYVVSTKTKMLSAFPNLAQFLSAWTIYCSIRCSQKPAYAAGLYHWQERLVHLARSHRNWSDVLNYIIKYFGRYQQAHPEAWFHPDPELITECFVVGDKGPATILKSGRKSESSNSNICRNWNQSKCLVKETIGRECSRRHVCLDCRGDHRAPNCPGLTKASSTKPSNS